jgi:hypothetical protein
VKPFPMTGGYLGVAIMGRTRAVHRLVLMAWRGVPKRRMDARHLDGVPTNNRLSNLCWGTRKQNHRDARIHKWITRLYCRGESVRSIAARAKIKPKIVRAVIAHHCPLGPDAYGNLWNFQQYPRLKSETLTA